MERPPLSSDTAVKCAHFTRPQHAQFFRGDERTVIVDNTQQR
jgi:hypothetical protein